MRIRYAKREDIERWLELRKALFPECSVALLEKEIEEIRADPSRQACIVAETQHGRILGFAECSIRPVVDGCHTRGVGYLEAWYVTPGFRRKGTGRLLVEKCMVWARERGCQEFASDCVLDNVVSYKAHRALGFEEALRLVHFRISLQDDRKVPADTT